MGGVRGQRIQFLATGTEKISGFWKENSCISVTFTYRERKSPASSQLTPLR